MWEGSRSVMCGEGLLWERSDEEQSDLKLSVWIIELLGLDVWGLARCSPHSKARG